MGGGRKGKKSKKSKPKTKAQKMAVANKKKYGGTASAAKANKAANKAKAKSYTKSYGAKSVAAANKAANRASIKAKVTASKTSPSKGGSISKGTTGVGPVKSGATYSKAVSKATNAPTKKTSGIGPYADGAKYAAALKASPPRFPDGTKVATHDKPLFKSVPARLDEPASPKYIEGMLQKNILPGTPSNPLGIKTAMLPGDNMGSILGTGAALGFGLSLPGMINEARKAGEQLKQNIERRINPDADKISAAGDIGNLTGLGITPAPSYFSIKSPESFGAPSQEAVDKAAGITAGGLNIGGSGFTPSNPSGGANARAIFAGASPNSVLNDPNFTPGPVAGDPFAQPGPGGPEPESDYTSYQPGSFYNQSDTNMNPTNFLRSTRNVITTPFRALGINNGLTNMLIPKSNEAIQDARDQRGPRPTLTRPKSRGGARLPVAPLTPEEILLPEQMAAAQAAPVYQQAAGQTGVDPNRLLQIQQEAYQQAFNPYNPLTVGGFNPFFRFFDRRGGSRRGAFRRAFRRD